MASGCLARFAQLTAMKSLALLVRWVLAQRATQVILLVSLYIKCVAVRIL